MGNGMSQVLPQLFVGSFRDAKDAEQLTNNNITHILSVHDNAKALDDSFQYLCINASDSASQDLSIHFSQSNDFIHSARLSGGSVLVHCLAGVSRSVTLTIAYIMTVTDLNLADTLKVVRGARSFASPNSGFKQQLGLFERDALAQERVRLLEKFPTESPGLPDAEFCTKLIATYQRWVSNGDKIYHQNDIDTVNKTVQSRKINDAERISAASYDKLPSTPTRSSNGAVNHPSPISEGVETDPAEYISRLNSYLDECNNK